MTRIHNGHIAEIRRVFEGVYRPANMSEGAIRGAMSSRKTLLQWGVFVNGGGLSDVGIALAKAALLPVYDNEIARRKDALTWIEGYARTEAEETLRTVERHAARLRAM